MVNKQGYITSGVTSKNPARSAGFFVFTAFKIYFDKRLKTKYPKTAQQFGFMLAMNKSLGKRGSVILPFKIHFDKRIKPKQMKSTR
jgi:hypothetical protein